MGQIVASKFAGAVNEADHQFTARLQDTIRLGQYGGCVIHEADGGHAENKVEAVIRKRKRFGDLLHRRDASFCRIVQHLACRVHAYLHAQRGGEASGADADGQPQASSVRMASSSDC